MFVINIKKEDQLYEKRFFALWDINNDDERVNTQLRDSAKTCVIAPYSAIDVDNGGATSVSIIGILIWGK